MNFTKETAKRTLRTFLQAFISYLCVNIVIIDFNGEREIVKQAVIGLCVSALAAGIAAVMNLEEKKLEVFEEVETDDVTTEDEV